MLVIVEKPARIGQRAGGHVEFIIAIASQSAFLFEIARGGVEGRVEVGDAKLPRGEELFESGSLRNDFRFGIDRDLNAVHVEPIDNHARVGLAQMAGQPLKNNFIEYAFPGGRKE